MARFIGRFRSGDVVAPDGEWAEGKRHVATFAGNISADDDGEGGAVVRLPASQGGYSTEEQDDGSIHLYEHAEPSDDRRIGVATSDGAVPAVARGNLTAGSVFKDRAEQIARNVAYAAKIKAHYDVERKERQETILQRPVNLAS